jgi:hypothetical protein
MQLVIFLRVSGPTIAKWLKQNVPWDAIFGGGIVWKALDLWNSRQRFGMKAKMDSAGHVVVDVVWRGGKDVFVDAIKVILVKPRVFRWLRLIRSSDPSSMIPMATLFDSVGRPIVFTENQPASYGGTVPRDPRPLPPRWNPFGRITFRRWTRRELRLLLLASEKKYFMRIKGQVGVLPLSSSVANANGPTSPTTAVGSSGRADAE